MIRAKFQRGKNCKDLKGSEKSGHNLGKYRELYFNIIEESNDKHHIILLLGLIFMWEDEGRVKWEGP